VCRVAGGRSVRVAPLLTTVGLCSARARHDRLPASDDR